jgi:aminodeoxyfutalosine synthase
VQSTSQISIVDPALEAIVAKVRDGVRLSREDGMTLEKTRDIHTLCGLANEMKRRRCGNRAGYIVNAHIDYTNVCVSGCSFCAFGRDKSDPDAYTLSAEEVIERIPEGVDEIHIVGGVNPDLGLKYFLDLLSTLRAKFPSATLKALTAVEIHALASREGLPVSEVIEKLKDAGLAMMPGGGAEIFDEKMRERICPGKITGKEWLDVHRVAHGMGIPTNCTMLYGHVENAEHRIDHLLRLRELQDETGGFVAYIPLPYLKGANKLADEAGPPDGTLDIRQVAIGRLILDNVPHIKAYWRALGIRMAQVALLAGADDLDGTVEKEDIMHVAGSDAPRSLTSKRLQRIITEAGLEPYRRDSFHNPVQEVGK